MPLCPLGLARLTVSRLKVKGVPVSTAERRTRRTMSLRVMTRREKALVVDAVAVFALPFFAVTVLQRVTFDGLDFMRTEEVPRLVEVFLGHFPKEVGITDGGEDVVCLHAVVAVVGAKLKKLGQVFVPHVEVDGYGSLAHAELVDCNGGVVDELHPADNTSCYTLEATDVATGSTYFAKVKPHAAAHLADLCEVVVAAIDAFEAVGHGVDEATRELVVGLARIREGGRGHGDFEATQHVVKLLYPVHAVGGFGHGEVEGYAEVHFLYRL